MTKNILILNYEYPPLGGGAGVVSQKYAVGLSELGNKVTVLTTWFEGEDEYYEEGNLKIIRLKSLRKKLFQSNPIEMLSWAYKSIRFLSVYLKENKYNICIAFFSIPGGIVAQYIHDIFKIQYVISTHGADIPGFYPRKMWKFHILTNWYAKKIWAQAKNIFVLTVDMKRLADKFGNPSKNIILPNGCNSDLFYPDFTKKNLLFTLLFVGRFCDEKDVFTILKAIKILKSETDNFMFYLVGDGPLKSEITEFIDIHELNDNIRMVGWVSKDELQKYYQSSHIQICSSKVEAMSIGILEALYSGLYILSTPVSGNTDMIEEGVNGEFFDIGDSKALGNKLLNWSQNYTKLTVNHEIIEELKEKYSWSSIILKLDKIIKND